MSNDHREFMLTFVTPTTTTRAFNFGKQSAMAGHARLSYREFFSTDARLEGATPERSRLWSAYRRGVTEGRVRRRRGIERAQEIAAKQADLMQAGLEAS